MLSKFIGIFEEVPKDNIFKRLCEVQGILEGNSSSQSDPSGDAFSEFEFP